jgi:hypothetical protein
MNREPAKTYVEDPRDERPVGAEVDGSDLEDLTPAERAESADLVDAAPEEFEESGGPEEFDAFDEPEEAAGPADSEEFPESAFPESARSAEFDQSAETVELVEPAEALDSAEPAEPAGAAVPVEPSTTEADLTAPLLASTVTEDFRDRWSEVQIGFVEDPQKSVAEADALLAEVARAYQDAVEERRSRISAARQDGSADTEDLRSALLGYRDIITTMLPAQPATAAR